MRNKERKKSKKPVKCYVPYARFGNSVLFRARRGKKRNIEGVIESENGFISIEWNEPVWGYLRRSDLLQGICDYRMETLVCLYAANKNRHIADKMLDDELDRISHRIKFFSLNEMEVPAGEECDIEIENDNVVFAKRMVQKRMIVLDKKSQLLQWWYEDSWWALMKKYGIWKFLRGRHRIRELIKKYKAKGE